MRKRIDLLYVKQFIFVALLLTVVGVLPSQSSAEQLLTKITIGTFSKSLGNAPYHVAKALHWYETDPALKGIKITHTIFNDRPLISQAFDKGELQMLFSGEVPAILCSAQGNQIRIVEIAGVVTIEILARKELPINSVADLRGKIVAVQQGTSSHWGLLNALKTAGIPLSEVDVRYMAAAEARTAFEAKQIDAWAVWSPFIEQQQIVNKTARVLKGGDIVMTNVATVPTYMIEKNPKIVQALVNVLDRAKKWIKKNPKKAATIIAKDLDLDEAIVKEALRKFNYESTISDKAIPDYQNKADFLAEQDKTRQSKKVDVKATLIDMQFTKKK